MLVRESFFTVFQIPFPLTLSEIFFVSEVILLIVLFVIAWHTRIISEDRLFDKYRNLFLWFDNPDYPLKIGQFQMGIQPLQISFG